MLTVGTRVRVKVGGYAGYLGRIRTIWTAIPDAEGNPTYTVDLDNGEAHWYYSQKALEVLESPMQASLDGMI